MPILLAGMILMLASSLPGICADEEWTNVKREIHREMGGKDLVAQMKALDKLSGQDNLDAAKFVVDLSEKKSVSPALTGYACRIMSTYRNEAVQKYLADIIRKNPLCQKFVFDAISRMGIPDTKQIFIDILTGPKRNNKDYPDYYVMSLRAMGCFPEQDDKIVDLLVSKLKDTEPQGVRKSAAEALGGIRSPKCLPALVEYVGDQVISETAVESAERLTGLDLGADRDKWLKWMAEQGDKVKLAYLSREEYGQMKEKRKKEEALKEEPIRETSFYGIKLKGRNIYFILDRSGSMNTAGVSGSRISKLKMEMTQIVDKLENSDRKYDFGVYFFGGLLKFPTNGLCSNKSKNMERLKRFLDGVEAYGNTPLKTALATTFDEVVPKNNIDTIYLLTDGEPTDGTPDDIVSMVSERNLGSYVRINTISLGQPSDMLKKISEMTGGEYVYVP